MHRCIAQEDNLWVVGMRVGFSKYKLRNNGAESNSNSAIITTIGGPWWHGMGMTVDIRAIQNRLSKVLAKYDKAMLLYDNETGG